MLKSEKDQDNESGVTASVEYVSTIYTIILCGGDELSKIKNGTIDIY